MSEEAPSKSGRIKLAIAAVAIVGLLVASRFIDVQGIFQDTLQWIKDLGFAGMLAFAALYVVACVLLLPGSILTLGAGAIYGVVQGSILVSIASTLGATAAFLVGRYLARDWIAQKIERNEKFKAVDDAVAREGWKIVGLTRLSPVFPFNFLNYAYGVTQVSLRDYFFASWIGMMPATIVYVYFGSLAGSVATLGEDGREKSIIEWVLFGVGLAAAFAVTYYVTKVARNALNKRVEIKEAS